MLAMILTTDGGDSLGVIGSNTVGLALSVDSNAELNGGTLNLLFGSQQCAILIIEDSGEVLELGRLGRASFLEADEVELIGRCVALYVDAANTCQVISLVGGECLDVEAPVVINDKLGVVNLESEVLLACADENSVLDDGRLVDVVLQVSRCNGWPCHIIASRDGLNVDILGLE